MTTYDQLLNTLQIKKKDNYNDQESEEIKSLNDIKMAANEITLFNLPPIPGSVMIYYVLKYAGFDLDSHDLECLKKFGNEGEGKHITIWTKNSSDDDDENAFLEIDDKFLATGINDNGGPGLIEFYDFNLYEYTPRHLSGHTEKPRHLCRKK